MSPDQEKEEKRGTIDASGPVKRSNTEKDPYIEKDDKEHPAVHVAQMVCKLVLTLFTLYSVFLFLSLAVFLFTIKSKI
jgi:hypothetical protein